MRTKEELLNMINRVNAGKNKKNLSDIDKEYLDDVKTSLQWVLNNLSGKASSKVEEEIRKIKNIADDWYDKVVTYDAGVEAEALSDFINREFSELNIPDYERFERAVCNISEAWDWALEENSTEAFLDLCGL